MVRLLRDSGYICFGYEPYTEPVLAASYTFRSEEIVYDYAPYRAVIATEVLEHLSEPKEFISKVLSITDTLIFTTELLCGNKFNKDWWYYSPDTGQHISFHTHKSLHHLALNNGCYFFSSSDNSIHIISRSIADVRFFRLLAGKKRLFLFKALSSLFYLLNKQKSLIMADHLEAKKNCEKLIG